MNTDFWDVAFGGKDMLRLYLGAKDFRIRRYKYTVSATFKYGDGSRIEIVYKYVSMFHDKKSYLVTLFKKEGGDPNRSWAAEVGRIRNTVQQLTGTVLDCFQS